MILAGAVLAGLLTVYATTSQSDEAKPAAKGSVSSSTNDPQYNEKGELKRPTGFETWVFVGSNMGIEYREDADGDAATKEPKKFDAAKSDAPPKAANFHNVYINPEAYQHYVKTGSFPEKTVLILDIYKAQAGEPGSIVSEGRFPGKRTGVAAAVKNSSRPDGLKTPWAYYDFKLDQTFGKAFANKACYDCHLEHADEDNVWVRFYPTLLHARGEKK